MTRFQIVSRIEVITLAALLTLITLLPTSCGSGQPVSADPLPQNTSSGSSGTSGASCSDPCSSSNLYSDVTSVFEPAQIGAVRDADQFPGADFAAKVNAAVANLPADGGTVDARNFAGQQVVSSSIILNKPVDLLLPPVHITISGAPLIVFAADGSRVVGQGIEGTELIRTDPGDVIADDTSAIRKNIEISDLTVGSMQQTSTKSAGINIENARNVNIRDVVVHGGYYGIRFSGTWDVSLRDFLITSSGVAGLYFEERQNAAFPSTTGGYIANGEVELCPGNGVDLEGFVDRVAFLQVDSNSNQGEGFRINTIGMGIDSGDGGFERFFSCYASQNKGTGFDVRSNNNKFFDVYAEGRADGGIMVSGWANDFFYAEANGFSGEGLGVSGADNRFHSLTINGSADGVDFLPGSDGSVIFGGQIINSSGVGIEILANAISLYNVKQSGSAGGDIELKGTIKRAVGSDGIPDLLGPSVTLSQGGPTILQGSSATPPPGACTPGSEYLVTVPSTINMYICQGNPTAAWVGE